MFKNLKKNQEGFTIIEVLIVLAIAGLIMLIVFLAIPALQRNQRNNARNSEASRVSSAVSECLANRNGRADSCDGLADLANLGIDANGTTGNINSGYQQFTRVTFDTKAAAGPAGGAPTANPNGLTEINIEFDATCSEDGSGVVTSTNAREFAVSWRNEPNVPRCIGSESN